MRLYSDKILQWIAYWTTLPLCDFSNCFLVRWFCDHVCKMLPLLQRDWRDPLSKALLIDDAVEGAALHSLTILLRSRRTVFLLQRLHTLYQHQFYYLGQIWALKWASDLDRRLNRWLHRFSFETKSGTIKSWSCRFVFLFKQHIYAIQWNKRNVHSFVCTLWSRISLLFWRLAFRKMAGAMQLQAQSPLITNALRSDARINLPLMYTQDMRGLFFWGLKDTCHGCRILQTSSFQFCCNWGPVESLCGQ